MRKFLVLVLGVALVAGFALSLGGCASREEVVEEPIIEPEIQEETSALTGEDIPLTEQPEDIIYVETHQFEDIHFEFDKYAIRPVDEGVLSSVARWLEENDEIRLLIEGHCDERGTNEYNMALGEQRALSARRFLVSLGVDAARIGTISYGEERPLDPRSDEDAWAKNRRAHFVVSE